MFNFKFLNITNHRVVYLDNIPPANPSPEEVEEKFKKSWKIYDWGYPLGSAFIICAVAQVIPWYLGIVGGVTLPALALACYALHAKFLKRDIQVSENRI